jgi:hypothetical protein
MQLISAPLSLEYHWTQALISLDPVFVSLLGFAPFRHFDPRDTHQLDDDGDFLEIFEVSERLEAVASIEQMFDSPKGRQLLAYLAACVNFLLDMYTAKKALLFEMLGTEVFSDFTVLFSAVFNGSQLEARLAAGSACTHVSLCGNAFPTTEALVILRRSRFLCRTLEHELLQVRYISLFYP